ncbi:MAG: class II aldolase/adducin family protein [Planctomycetota bacterium]|jgi:ribulose-5-phosphate 4-epimerase/fuculose-1-phosphate aldolase
MPKEHELKIKEFIQAAHKIASYGLVKCSSGNLSARLDDKLIALSTSGAWLAELTKEQVAICDINTGQCLKGKPSTIESTFHLGILRNKPQTNVVLHFQSPYATAIACGKPEDYNYNVIIELPFYIGPPGIVEYLPAGSEELANAVIEKAKDHNMIIMKNHGLTTFGKDYNDTIQRAVFFELACQILLCQNNPYPLSVSAVETLRKASSV